MYQIVITFHTGSTKTIVVSDYKLFAETYWKLVADNTVKLIEVV